MIKRTDATCGSGLTIRTDSKNHEYAPLKTHVKDVSTHLAKIEVGLH
jgi:hypothetical protein